MNLSGSLFGRYRGCCRSSADFRRAPGAQRSPGACRLQSAQPSSVCLPQPAARRPVPPPQRYSSGPPSLPAGESPSYLAPTPRRPLPAAAYGLARLVLLGAQRLRVPDPPIIGVRSVTGAVSRRKSRSSDRNQGKNIPPEQRLTPLKP